MSANDPTPPMSLGDDARDLLLYSSGELDEPSRRRLEQRLGAEGAEAEELRSQASMLCLLELGGAWEAPEASATPAVRGGSRRSTWRWGIGALAAAAALVLLWTQGPFWSRSDEAIEDSVASPNRVAVDFASSPGPTEFSQRLLRQLRNDRGPLLPPPLLAGAKQGTPVRVPLLPPRTRLRDRNPSLDAFLNLRRSK